MKLSMTDEFWKRYITLIKEEMIPYQWAVLNDEANITIDKERDEDYIPSEKSHAIENFKIAAGRTEGEHYGWLFQDSDVYKWLESAANSYAIDSDKQLAQMMEEVVTLIEEAQEENGYISTFYQLEAPQLKFRRLFESHELYCAGHLIEAAVAYYKATNDDRLIIVSENLVKCIRNRFGNEKGKIKGADGHQEIELALVKLYEVTGNETYIDLSKWFLDIRGQNPEFYENQIKENNEWGLEQKAARKIDLNYLQAHQSVYEQEDAVGHAVRLVYMAAAMAEVSSIKDDQSLFQASKRLWESIITKRMYITGGIGSTVHGEAFTSDYDLPNDTMYCETCASIGLLYFARAMLNHDVNRDYAEIMERTLYNTIISGMALDGRHFFYVNPLESDPKVAEHNPGKSHVKASRPSWFGCACCPPNVARTLTSLDRYMLSQDKEGVYFHLYADFDASIKWNENELSITQKTSMPYNGFSTIKITGVSEPIRIALREPSWSKRFKISSKDNVEEQCSVNGYTYLIISTDTEIEVTFDMDIIEWVSHPLVKGNKDKVALQRGPFIYCLEEADNEEHLHLVSLIEKPTAHAITDDHLGETVVLKGQGIKSKISKEWTSRLYLECDEKEEVIEKELTFIPYHLWANRSIGEMTVWINRKQGL